MGILGNVILVLVIGFTVTITACAIIQKICDERRKSSERAGQLMGDAFNELYKMILVTYDELSKREEEKQAKSISKYINYQKAVEEKTE